MGGRGWGGRVTRALVRHLLVVFPGVWIGVGGLEDTHRERGCVGLERRGEHGAAGELLLTGFFSDLWLKGVRVRAELCSIMRPRVTRLASLLPGSVEIYHARATQRPVPPRRVPRNL